MIKITTEDILLHEQDFKKEWVSADELLSLWNDYNNTVIGFTELRNKMEGLKK